jgi:hypothetical protein
LSERERERERERGSTELDMRPPRVSSSLGSWHKPLKNQKPQLNKIKNAKKNPHANQEM